MWFTSTLNKTVAAVSEAIIKQIRVYSLQTFVYNVQLSRPIQYLTFVQLSRPIFLLALMKTFNFTWTCSIWARWCFLLQSKASGITCVSIHAHSVSAALSCSTSLRAGAPGNPFTPTYTNNCELLPSKIKAKYKVTSLLRILQLLQFYLSIIAHKYCLSPLWPIVAFKWWHILLQALVCFGGFSTKWFSTQSLRGYQSYFQMAIPVTIYQADLYSVLFFSKNWFWNHEGFNKVFSC